MRFRTIPFGFILLCTLAWAQQDVPGSANIGTGPSSVGTAVGGGLAGTGTDTATGGIGTGATAATLLPSGVNGGIAKSLPGGDIDDSSATSLAGTGSESAEDGATSGPIVGQGPGLGRKRRHGNMSPLYGTNSQKRQVGENPGGTNAQASTGSQAESQLPGHSEATSGPDSASAKADVDTSAGQGSASAQAEVERKKREIGVYGAGMSGFGGQPFGQPGLGVGVAGRKKREIGAARTSVGMQGKRRKREEDVSDMMGGVGHPMGMGMGSMGGRFSRETGEGKQVMAGMPARIVREVSGAMMHDAKNRQNRHVGFGGAAQPGMVGTQMGGQMGAAQRGMAGQGAMQAGRKKREEDMSGMLGRFSRETGEGKQVMEGKSTRVAREMGDTMMQDSKSRHQRQITKMGTGSSARGSGRMVRELSGSDTHNTNRRRHVRQILATPAPGMGVSTPAVHGRKKRDMDISDAFGRHKREMGSGAQVDSVQATSPHTRVTRERDPGSATPLRQAREVLQTTAPSITTETSSLISTSLPPIKIQRVYKRETPFGAAVDPKTSPNMRETREMAWADPVKPGMAGPASGPAVTMPRVAREMDAPKPENTKNMHTRDTTQQQGTGNPSTAPNMRQTRGVQDQSAVRKHN